MIPHAERYEHLGEVRVYIQDLGAVWERERARRHVTVDPNDALFVVEHDLRVAPALAWDYVPKPEYRAIQFGSDRQTVVSRPNGRVGPGAVYHGTRAAILCGKVHGPFVGRLTTNIVFRIAGSRFFAQGLRTLAKQIETDVAADRVVPAEPAEIRPGEIEAAIEESLTR